MTKQCEACKGAGYINISEQECPDCKGSGKPKSLDLTKMTENDLGSLLEGGGKCQKCGGSGTITVKQKCEVCGGRGEKANCRICGQSLDADTQGDMCASCATKPLVQKLSPACDTSDLEIGMTYEGVVDSLANFGAFVNLNPRTRGLAHEKHLTRTPDVGETIFVQVKNIASNGNIDLVPV
ncbi:MAG: phosphoesterase, partial [Methanosarcinales archaeon]|nr:phosphoesterase [Methanosarcinales archaeon]